MGPGGWGEDEAKKKEKEKKKERKKKKKELKQGREVIQSPAFPEESESHRRGLSTS